MIIFLKFQDLKTSWVSCFYLFLQCLVSFYARLSVSIFGKLFVEIGQG